MIRRDLLLPAFALVAALCGLVAIPSALLASAEGRNGVAAIFIDDKVPPRLAPPAKINPGWIALLERSLGGSELDVIAPGTRLVGVVTGNGQSIALIQLGEGDTQLLGVGQQVGSWTIEKISGRSVTFARGSTRLVRSIDDDPTLETQEGAEP